MPINFYLFFIPVYQFWRKRNIFKMWASQYSKECQKKYEKSQNVNSKNSQRQTKKKIIHNCSFCDFSVVNEQILNEHILSLHVMPLPLNLENSSSLLDNAPNYLVRCVIQKRLTWMLTKFFTFLSCFTQLLL